MELSDKGTVTTFCIVNVPFLGQQIKPPYVAAYVLLDGADIPFLHLILECDAADVRMGMRVQAKWRPREEWGGTPCATSNTSVPRANPMRTTTPSNTTSREHREP